MFSYHLEKQVRVVGADYVTLQVNTHSIAGKPEYLVCQLNNNTSCPKAICPDTTLNFICNIEAQQLGFTKWLLPNGTCTNSDEKMVLLQPKYGNCNPSSNSQHGTCGPFTAQNVASSGCVNSSLSVVATQRLNGTEIRCMNYDGMSLFPIGNATISIVGELSVTGSSKSIHAEGLECLHHSLSSSLLLSLVQIIL